MNVPQLVVVCCLWFSPALSLAQNVGIGTNTPQDKLHAAGYLRSDSLQSASDTVLTLASPQGRIIALPSGQVGEVLVSQGSTHPPTWKAMSAAGGRIHTLVLTGAVSNTASSSSATTNTLLSHTFVPDNDTVIVQYSASGWITASTLPAATPGHPYLFRLVVNGTTINQIGAAPHRNTSSLADRGRLFVSYSFPVAVTAGVPNTITVNIVGLMTASGSITLSIDPSTLSNSASMIIYDLPTN
jgi:hypothetical protein